MAPWLASTEVMFTMTPWPEPASAGRTAAAAKYAEPRLSRTSASNASGWSRTAAHRPAGIVHEDVEAAERPDRTSNEVRAAGGNAEVRRQADGEPAAGRDARRGRLGIGGVAVVMERDRGAALGQANGDRPPDADPGTGHERAAAIESGVVGTGHGGCSSVPATTRTPPPGGGRSRASRPR